MLHRRIRGPVPTPNKQKFIDHADLGGSVFMARGTTRVFECLGEEVPDGRLTNFRKTAQANSEGTVVLSRDEWRTKPPHAFDAMMTMRKIDIDALGPAVNSN